VGADRHRGAYWPPLLRGSAGAGRGALARGQPTAAVVAAGAGHGVQVQGQLAPAAERMGS